MVTKEFIICLAVYRPAGIQIAKRYLRNGFDSNEDGAGFAVARDGKIEIFKGFFHFKEFWKAYRDFADHPALIHFRWATHGQCTAENCHPFSLCNDQFAVIHNGIIDIDTDSDKEKSDTRHFCELILQPVLESMDMHSPAVKYLIESSIGSFNKIVLLRADGQYVIFNENAGKWFEGSWFSNEGYAHPSYGCSSGRVWEQYQEYWKGLGYTSIDKEEEEDKSKFPDWVPEVPPGDDDEEGESSFSGHTRVQLALEVQHALQEDLHDQRFEKGH